MKYIYINTLNLILASLSIENLISSIGNSILVLEISGG